MSNAPSEVRHDVAWLQPVRWATCVVLWTLLGVLWLFPHLDLSLREVSWLGLAAAICRTVVVSRVLAAVSACRRRCLALALAADAALLTGLLDITGGPFNPFIVMYAAYIWVAVVAISPVWAAVVGVASAVRLRLACRRSPAGRIAGAPSAERLSRPISSRCGSRAPGLRNSSRTTSRAHGRCSGQRQAQLDEARERAARSERLASLTTLAAGAAHELSTPLATIAVAARELERNAARVAEPGRSWSGAQGRCDG